MVTVSSYSQIVTATLVTVTHDRLEDLHSNSHQQAGCQLGCHVHFG